MRWRKVLSPLGLPSLAVICTRANRRLVRGAALSLQAAVLRFSLCHSSSPLSSLCTIYPLLPFLSGCVWLPLWGAFTLLFLTAPSSLFVSKSLSFWLPNQMLWQWKKSNSSLKEAHQLFFSFLNCSSEVIRICFSISRINSWMWTLDILPLHLTHQLRLPCLGQSNPLHGCSQGWFR